MRLHTLSSALVLSLVVLTLSSGCGDSRSTAAELDGRAFLFESAQGFQPVADTTLRLMFAGGTLSASAGCNSMSGSFTLRDGRLIVGALATTEIGCDPARQAQDTWLASFLGARPLLSLSGDWLTLTGTDATLVLLDRTVADPDRPLVGTVWTVDTFLTNDAASNLALSTPPTIVFGADGGVRINAGCNDGAGHYTTSNSQVELSGIAYTLAFCDGALGTTDAQIRALLNDGTLHFTIVARRLTLRRGNLGISALSQ